MSQLPGQVPASVLARLRSFGNNLTSSATPKGGIQWPDPGKGLFMARGMVIKEEGMKVGAANFQSISIGLKWKWLDDPEKPDDGLEFMGQRFRLVGKSDLEKFPEGYKAGVQGDMDRWAGFVKVVLGNASMTDEEAIAGMYVAFENRNDPLVLKLDISKPNKKGYQKEWALERMPSTQPVNAASTTATQPSAAPATAQGNAQTGGMAPILPVTTPQA